MHEDEGASAPDFFSPAPRTMAIDVGSVRIGVALSCPFGRMAQPLCVLLRRDRPFERIAELCATHEVAALVVGRPLRLSGEAGPAVAAIEAFVAHLAPHLNCPIEWHDERLTTAAAERSMIALGARRERRRQQVDQVAAALILQGYLDRTGRAQR